MRAAVTVVHGADSINGGRRVCALFPELRAAAQWAAETDRLDLAMDLCQSVESVFLLDIDLGALATDVDAHPNARQHPRSLLLESFELFDCQLKGAPLPVDQIRQLIARFLAGEPSSILACFGPMALSHSGHHSEALEAALRVRAYCLTLPDGPTRRLSRQAASYLSGKPEYLSEVRQCFAVARNERSDYWIGFIGMTHAHVMAEIDPAEAREIVLNSIGAALDVEMPLLVQTSLVLYALLLILEDGSRSIDERVSAVLAREIARARRGYRLRAQHFFVLGALLSVAGEHDLAAKALAAYDAVGTPSSARTKAMINSARANIDARLANAGINPAPTPAPADLPAIASQIEEALRATTG